MANNVSVDKVIKGLDKIKEAIYLIEDEFLRESLIWIRNRANFYLDQRTGGFKGTTNVSKSWQINKVDGEPSTKVWELRNTNINGAYVEFGTGIIGKQNKHKKAKKSKYEYDVNKHGKKGWTWTNNEIGVTMYGFEGYQGKSFLYDAYFDYKHNKIYVEIYTTLFKKAVS